MEGRDRWNSRFDTDEYIFGTQPNRFLTQQAHRLPAGSKVLAIADGEGRNGVWLAEQGHRVTSVDISERGQAKAARLAQERGVTLDLRIEDVVEWDYPDAAFDAVVGIFIQFTAPEGRKRMFSGMKRATRPGGLILLEGYRPKQLDYATGGPKQLENLYTEELLRHHFGDWSIEHLESYDREISEGAGHHGMSALIDLVAQRPAMA
ncbi:class I SAM-dependent methyltransferase [Stakelama sediminis]|nr:class I SAM-dependent methyltransferase [Stakelama sediminis]